MAICSGMSRSMRNEPKCLPRSAKTLAKSWLFDTASSVAGTARLEDSRGAYNSDCRCIDSGRIGRRFGVAQRLGVDQPEILRCVNPFETQKARPSLRMIIARVGSVEGDAGLF